MGLQSWEICWYCFFLTQLDLITFDQEFSILDATHYNINCLEPVRIKSPSMTHARILRVGQQTRRTIERFTKLNCPNQFPPYYMMIGFCKNKKVWYMCYQFKSIQNEVLGSTGTRTNVGSWEKRYEARNPLNTMKNRRSVTPQGHGWGWVGREKTFKDQYLV